MNLVRTFVCGAALLVCGAAPAGGFSVDPVHLELQAGAATTSLKVTNNADQAELLQVTVLRWARQDGSDVYQTEPGAVVTPPMFRLAPRGGSQVVRIGFNHPPGDGIGRAWRVMVEEVPENSPVAPVSTVNLRLRMSLPLVLQPSRPKHALHWALWRGERSLRLSADNQGNVVERIDELRLSAIAGQPTYCAQAGPIYLFPGETQELTLPVHTDHPPSSAVKLLVQGTPPASAAELVLRAQ
ncbi:MAG: fimbria/pilus periplasmic chaperone [Sinobacteraceae bacterium]|nr:fimbria/pilus periplasmic chaperone [Nevskiaceae bacterium]